jgi:hypothetical protein
MSQSTSQNAEFDDVRLAADPDALAGEQIDADEADQLAQAGHDEYDRAADSDEESQLSIDDALETDRVIEEGADSRNTDGYRFDETRERGTDETVAAEQGNRDEDRMEADTASEELDEIARGDDPAL